MTIAELAADFAALCKAGKDAEAGAKHWADDVVSIEAAADAPVARGRAAVEAKAQWWYENHTVHEVVAHGPYVNGEQFAMRFEIDVTPKATGARMRMDEVALYTVENGKIIEERFFY